MISAHERANLLHIMKINRLTLLDSDTAQLTFTRQSNGIHDEIAVLVIEDTPSVTIKKNGTLVYSETVKSVDDFVDISRRTALPISRVVKSPKSCRARRKSGVID